MTTISERIKAPDFGAQMAWLNTDRPLMLKDFRGKVVVLDFWTYCCINCMHIIPDLKKLEQKYKNELVVIGVHSAKFATEKGSENIRQAILRYGIEHPVVNDKDMTIWEEFNVHAWPTLFLIDPNGNIVGYHSGEGVYDVFDKAIAQVISESAAKGKLNRTQISFALEKYKVPEMILSFPGKVVADALAQRLYIADSGHNRIIITSLDGTIEEIAGSGAEGLADGNYAQAKFNHPQGMAVKNGMLYVADTENHALRQLDLAKQTVITIAGNGQQAPFGSSGGVAAEAMLSSPWDVTCYDDQLYIAMAGLHQIWRMDLKTGKIEPYAGSGREARIDGPLATAALAQTSGIVHDGKRLYFADSETSSIRWADLNPAGSVGTIAGLDLFVFGDMDGKGSEVRLQHPLGVAISDGMLYIADTYNSKIKKIDIAKKTATTVAVNGKDAQFNEPGGLSIIGDTIFLADTNHHLIKVIDLRTGKVRTLELKNLAMLKEPQRRHVFKGTAIKLAQTKVDANTAEIIFEVILPKGFKINEQAPNAVIMQATGATFADGKTELTFDAPKFPLHAPLTIAAKTATVKIDAIIYYCRAENESLCFFKEQVLEIPVMIDRAAGTKVIKIVISDW